MIPKADFPDPLIKERGRLRMQYFTGWLKKPFVIVVLVAAVALALVHPLLVPVAWIVVLVAAFWAAYTRAANEWWALLAGHLSMTVDGDEDLLPATPLLRSGDEREVLRGMVAPDRRLAQFRSTDVRRDDKGTHRTHHDYTVVMTVDAVPAIRFLAAHEHIFGAIKWLGDDHRGRLPSGVDDFRCESVELHEKYELRSSNEDEPRAREIFTPTFMVWFGRNGVEFEYENGALAVFADRVLDHAEEYKVLLRRAAIIRQQIAGQRPDLGGDGAPV